MAEEKGKKEPLGTKIVRGVKTGAMAVTGIAGKQQPKQTRPQRVKLLFSVVGKDDGAALKEVLDDCSTSLGFVFSGTGTARSAMLDYLGIGQTEKAIVVSLIPENDEEKIMREIRSKMALYLVGRGISFTVPLTGVSEIVAGGICKAASEKSTEGRKIMTDPERKYDLIVAAVAAGEADVAMEAARAAGAAGGTVVRARSIGNAKAEQFIGITLTQEQEILLILAKRESKLAIMNALSESAGLKTEAGGVIFSLPVDRTAGISAADEAEMRRESEEKHG